MDGRRVGRFSGVITVELVPGREGGVLLVRGLDFRSARSVAFLFFEEGRGGEDRSGFPKAKPTAATPTVLVAMSCQSQQVQSESPRPR